MAPHKNTMADFWKKVDKSGDCWLWMGWRNRDGYGEFRFRDKHNLAHRLSYEFFNEVVPEGMCVLHKCDNPPCVNPAHLFLGTHTDNVRDRCGKGHSAHNSGERCGASKLTADQVRSIRVQVQSGKRKKAIAEDFGVAIMTIYAITERRSWGWLE